MIHYLRRQTATLSPLEQGMGLMASAMLIVPCLDALAKLLSDTLSPVQIGFIRFTLQTLILSVFFLRKGRKRIETSVMGVLLLSGFLIAAAVTFLFWALAYMPMANTIAIFFVEPLILTLLSAYFLKEKVGWHRYTAVAVGLIGALIVIRPNWTLFGWVTILPLAAGIFYAGHMVLIRYLSTYVSGLESQIWSGFFAAIFLGIALLVGQISTVELFAWTKPDPHQWSLLAIMGVLSAMVYFMVNTAFKLTSASILAPFQYLEIVSATLLGYVLFSDYPDAITWLGTFIILSSGLYMFYRERRAKTQEH